MTLSTLEIAQMRAEQSSYLPDTCTLQTRTLASDGMGGQTQTWANTYTSVACRVSPVNLNRSESVQADQLAATTAWVLTVAHNQTIDETMRCVHDSETFEIVSLFDTHSNRTARRAYMRRLD